VPLLVELKAFKLLSIAGRVSSRRRNEQTVQRIYGRVPTKEELALYLERQEQAKAPRPSANSARDLNFFTSRRIRPGSPPLDANWAIIRQELQDFIGGRTAHAGHSQVFTPTSAKTRALQRVRTIPVIQGIAGSRRSSKNESLAKRSAKVLRVRRSVRPASRAVCRSGSRRKSTSARQGGNE